MIILLALIVGVMSGLAVGLFLLGFRIGGDSLQDELARVRLESAEASRRIHDLTRDAFVALAQRSQHQAGS